MGPGAHQRTLLLARYLAPARCVMSYSISQVDTGMHRRSVHYVSGNGGSHTRWGLVL